MHSKEVMRAVKLSSTKKFLSNFGGKRRFTLEETNLNKKLNEQSIDDMTMSQTSRAAHNISPYKEDRSIYKGQASIASELKPSA